MNKCPACGQFLKSPVTYPLNRNAIGYLIKIFTIIKNSTPQKKYIETKECFELHIEKQKVIDVIIPYLHQNKDNLKIRNILKNICFDLGYKEKELLKQNGQ